jgi:hypothetical protein
MSVMIYLMALSAQRDFMLTGTNFCAKELRRECIDSDPETNQADHNCNVTLVHRSDNCHGNRRSPLQGYKNR